MAEENLQNINIKVGSRSYPIKVKIEEKESIQNLEKDINSKIQSFKKDYADIDDIDALSMTLISLAFDLSKNNIELSNKLLDESLTELDKALEDALS